MYRFALIATFAALVACSDESYKHDPEPYRQQIEEIETLLSKPNKERGDGGRLHTMCANLAGAVGKSIDNHTAKETVMNVLISVGETFAHREEQDLPWDLTEARAVWLKARTAIFQDADWYRL